MDLGLFSLLPQRDVGRPIREVYDDTIALVRDAEDIGFEISWFAEHHFGNFCMCPSPLVMAAHCAALVDRIKLGTAVLVLPLYHPMRVLEEIGMVDVLSRGRLVVGIGSGYQTYEFDRFDVRLEDNWAMTHEFLDILEMGLEQGRVAYDGVHYRVPEAVVAVRALQRPTPPIFVAGNEPRYLQRAARKGYVPFATVGPQPVDVMLKLKEFVAGNFAEAGRDPDNIPFAMQRSVYVTDDKRDALDAAERALYNARIVMAFRNRCERLEGARLIPQPFEGELSPEQILANIPIGDVESCAERLVAEIRAVRPSHLSFFVQFGGIDGKRARRSLERLGAEVLPLVDKALGGLGAFGPTPEPG